MKLKDQIITLDQAKKLSELGVMQGVSVFYYNDNYGSVEFNRHNIGGYEKAQHCFSAFTVAEMGTMLPSGYDTMRFTEHPEDRWFGYDTSGDTFPGEDCWKTEAEARAAMLIHLLETNTITAEEVNARLKA
jgi:hypothetical protein